MADYVYVDNSNLYIEGRRVSAVKEKMVKNIHEAMNDGIFDNAYTISFGKLYDFLCGTDKHREISRVALFGSRPPPNDGIWTIAEKAGFELHLEDRNIRNKEKKIDTQIATFLTRDAYKSGAPSDTFVLVAGDADYVPTINLLKEDGYFVEVVFWDHASQELKKAASRFVGLDKHLEHLRF